MGVLGMGRLREWDLVMIEMRVWIGLDTERSL